jgi:hypothetical protein
VGFLLRSWEGVRCRQQTALRLVPRRTGRRLRETGGQPRCETERLSQQQAMIGLGGRCPLKTRTIRTVAGHVVLLFFLPFNASPSNSAWANPFQMRVVDQGGQIHQAQ